MTLLRSSPPSVAAIATLVSLSALAFGVLAGACEKPDAETHGAPPPPVVSAKPGACAGGGGVVADAVSASFFPRSVDTYCIDPQGEVRTYGEQGKLDMDAVCTTAFDGECAVYTQFGLKRLVSLRYVDGGGGAGTVDVYLSRFEDANGAYAMYTKRVVADGDPAEPTTPKPLRAGAAGSIGTGRAYVWRGSYLAELQYNNEQETPEALTLSSARILTAVAKAIGTALPGPLDLPPPVRALPTDHRVDNGLQLVLKDALGFPGFGPVAVGYYKDGSTRYRLVARVADGDPAALDAWKVVRGRPGALPVRGAGEEAVAVTPKQAGPDAPGGPKAEYVFARRGARVLGVGDEVLAADGSNAKALSRDEKVVLLKGWLDAAKSASK